MTGQTQQYCTLTGDNPVCILDPYPTSNILQIKRATARRVGSTYAPDFLGLMEVALINAWQVRRAEGDEYPRILLHLMFPMSHLHTTLLCVSFYRATLRELANRPPCHRHYSHLKSSSSERTES